MQGQYSVGVILSGTGSDGTLGICEIKAAGGVTFAQDEHSAQHGGMPQSAIASGAVDLVLPPDGDRRASRERPRSIPILRRAGRRCVPKSATEQEEFQRIIAALRTARASISASIATRHSSDAPRGA